MRVIAYNLVWFVFWMMVMMVVFNVEEYHKKQLPKAHPTTGILKHRDSAKNG